MKTLSFNWNIEVIKDFQARGKFVSALFDFDGTISLIREGWQQIMKPYFCEELLKTPKAESKEEIESCVNDFVDFLTGKQTIYQCMKLAEEINTRGGKSKNPQYYKDEYHNRLLNKIQYRLDGLESGSIKPEEVVVPGSFKLLQALRERGITIYLASGTDEEYVLKEAELLGVTQYCNGGIYGAKADYKVFSKKMIVQKIIETYQLSGFELVGFGDGYVEIENVNEAGGFTCGVASNEENKYGIDLWKRDRLIKAGADIIIPDYSEIKKLLDYLFPGGC